MAKLVRRSVMLLILLAVVFAVFLFLPFESLEAPRTPPEKIAEFEARAEDHFSLIEQGRNLDLPFPQMLKRAENPTSPAKIELGRLLYFDPLLSGDDTVSCAHCHHPDLGLSDNRGRSMGRGGDGLGPRRQGGALLRRGSPTVWNAAFNHVQFWDGRATDLEDQASKPILDPNEMAEQPERLVQQLKEIEAYVQLFDRAFGEDGKDSTFEHVTFENVTFAIGAFERTLVTTDSRFDRYARGDRGALNESERRGLNVFRSLKTRCFECHNIPTFANRDFKVIGVPDPEDLEAPDLGRAEIAGGSVYERAFKVPTLRNVALTAPYMHNGAFQTLSEVIDFYEKGGAVGQGLDLPNLDDKIRVFTLLPQERQDLIAFLHALTDESNKPTIPESVPSGLPVVPSLPNQSPEMAAFKPVEPEARQVEIERQGTTLFVREGQRIQDAIDLANPGDTVNVDPGTYHETLTLDMSYLTLAGQEIDGRRPILDGRGILSDGLIGSGSNIVIQGLDVRNYTANGLMINLGKDITFRDLKLDNTGLYGVYPVEVAGVLVEDCEVVGTRDAGIYVGQSKDIVVRRNRAYGNVTGIEIENSLNALVEDNDVYDNTGGILVFGLPNNPSKVSRGCRVIGNRVYENNRANFGDPTAIVSKVPAGTGILVLAGDEVEIAGNEIRDNHSFGIGVASLSTLLAAAEYDMDPYSDGVWVHDNAFQGNGTDPDAFVLDAGFSGKDLLWDLTGSNNRWDEPQASRLPYALPSSGWSEWRREANARLWRLLASL